MNGCRLAATSHYNPAMKPTGPSHLEIYILATGVLLGVILGPAVLGRVAPALYDKMFVGAIAAGQRQEEIAKKRDAVIDKMSLMNKIVQDLKDVKVTDVAIAEKEAEFKPQIDAAVAEANAAAEAAAVENAAFRAGVTARATALILAVLAIMVIEAITPAGSFLAGRLTTVRYALLALWVALLIAQPGMLRSLPIGFTAALVIVGVGAAVVPMGGKQTATTE